MGANISPRLMKTLENVISETYVSTSEYAVSVCYALACTEMRRMR
jgi:hypothetical protein